MNEGQGAGAGCGSVGGEESVLGWVWRARGWGLGVFVVGERLVRRGRRVERGMRARGRGLGVFVGWVGVF